MDPYAVLGVDEDASTDEMRTAYRRLVRIHHPDRHATASPTEQALHERRMAEVTGAWRLVNDPAALARHRANRAGGSGRASGAPGSGTGGSGAGGSGQRGPDRGRQAATGAFDYRDAASSEFTVSDQGRWGRTPTPGTNGPRPSVPRRTTAGDPTRRRSWGRRLMGVLFWVIVLVIFAGSAWVAFTDEGKDVYDRLIGGSDATDEPEEGSRSGGTTAGQEGTDGADQFAPAPTNMVELAAGTCFDLTVAPEDPTQPNGPGRVAGIQVRPCPDPHSDEALAAVRLAGEANTTWPGRSVLLAQLDPVCDDAFRTIIGRDPVPDDRWRRGRLTPSPESWAAGDRQGVCHVARSDGTASTGSLVDGTQAP